MDAAQVDPAGGIAVVVVAHQSEETLDECLSRLRAADGVAEVRVIDNDSRDATMDIVQRHALADPRLRFVANPDNPGFFVEADTLARLRDASTSLGEALVGAELRGEDDGFDPAARRRDPDFAAMLRSPAARDLSLPRDPAQPLQRVDAVSGALMLL